MSNNNWTQEYKANKHHTCSNESGCEICPGEYYLRVAQLNKSLPSYEGEQPYILGPAVHVQRFCLMHARTRA